MEEVTPEQEAALEEAYALEREAYQRECAGDIEDSFNLRRHALRLKEQILGQQNGYFATSLSGFAIDLYSNKLYDEAETLFRRTLAIYQTISGPESLDVADELYWLASVYDDRKQYTKTLQFLSRSIRLTRKNLGLNISRKLKHWLSTPIF